MNEIENPDKTIGTILHLNQILQDIPACPKKEKEKTNKAGNGRTKIFFLEKDSMVDIILALFI